MKRYTPHKEVEINFLTSDTPLEDPNKDIYGNAPTVEISDSDYYRLIESQTDYERYLIALKRYKTKTSK